MMAMADLIPVLIFAVTLAVILAIFVGGGSKRQLEKRVSRVTNRAGAKPVSIDRTGPSLLFGESAQQGLLGQLERKLVRIIPRPAALRLKLARAGLALSPGRFTVISAGFGLVLGAVVMVVKDTPVIAIATGFIAAFGLPNMFLSWRIRRRQLRFVALFPEAVELMVRGLKSGVPVNQTIASVGTEIQDPVGIEFRRVADSAAVGISLVDALWEAARRVEAAEFRFFIVAMTVQRETGGNLAETLENLADILRKRLQMRLKVKAMSSEARSSAAIIGVLPFAMFGILTSINPDYMMKLVLDTRGQIMAGSGLLLMLLGAVVMAKMVKFEI